MYQLRPHLSYGVIARTPVFLDLARDCYFEVDAAIAEALADLSSRGRACSCASIRRLKAANLIIDGAGSAGVFPASAPMLTHDLLDRPAPVPIGRAMTATGCAVALSRASLRRRPLHQLVGSPRPVVTDCATTSRVIAVSMAFEASRRCIPIGRRCLVDALALLRVLRRRDLSASLIFGVTLEPFAAHCWLQHGDCLLTGSLESIHGFTPVLTA